MRSADILRLALEALWQQKVRTLLTTTGVMLGTIVLVISVSLGQGVQETVLREISKHGDLRTVEVRPGSPKGDVDVPEKEREVKGDMSPERRDRMRKELVRRWKLTHRPAPAVKLTRERVEELSRLDHVERAVVGEAYTVWAVLGDRTDQAMAVSVGLNEMQFRDRVIVGDFFSSLDARDVLVSELLLYKLGVRDDADLNAAVGRTLRLELRGRGPAPTMMLLTLLNAGGPMSSAEEKILAKVVSQLPAAVARMDNLSPQELATLQTMLSRPPEKPVKRGDAVVWDLTIRGVLRTADESEAAGRWNWVNREADVFLPPTTAEDLFSRLADHGEQGYRTVLLEVDSIDNVKEVAKQVEAMGFGTYTLMQYVEAERFLYLMIFAGMSLIAIVALGVSALGIGNTMLMGVLERVREIGVMKAVGAGEGQIQLLFLIEGMLIGLVGGLIGLGVAYGLSFPGDAWVRSLLAGNTTIKLEVSLFVFPGWLWLGAPLFAAGLTTLAAVYPARRAAKVNTVEALRHE